MRPTVDPVPDRSLWLSVVPRLVYLERASTLVAAVDDSNTNIQTAIIVSQLAPTVRIVVRVGDEMYEQLARRAGADEVIIPEVASGEQVSGTL